MPPTVSRSSRAQHSGNAPTAPRTEVCEVCDAKFTRNSHLQRHMLSHTGQRLHQCQSCHTTFARKDLLLRHGKNCSGNPMRKSKRKSCEACAATKTKCDLVKPCGGCVAKGKDCVFVNDPSPLVLQRHEERNKDARTHVLPLLLSDSHSSSTSGGSSSPLSVADSDTLATCTLPGILEQDPVDARGTREYPNLYEFWSLSTQNQHYEDPDASRGAFGAVWDMFTIPSAATATPTSAMPAPSFDELNDYLDLFFAHFNIQIPLLHAPTIAIALREPILLDAMRACGAVYAGTPQARKFTDDTIMKAIRGMESNMASSSESTFKHDDLIIATVLLQFLCIHHETKGMRNMGKSAHDQLFKMMDSWQIFERVKTWTQRCRPEALSARDVQEAWTDWARCESLRRAIMAAFIEEGCMLCCLSVAPSSRGHAEYEFNLTCDDDLWQASSAVEWRRIWRTARSPSMALTGVPSQLASRQLNRRGALFECRVPSTLNLHPMDLFYLIHTLLREILERASVSWKPDAPEETAVAMAALQADFQAALNIWMVLWKSVTASLPADHQPSFFKNALPFYWLTQVILSALQFGDVMHLIEMGDKRVFVMDAWLQRIRLFIRSGIHRKELWADMASVCQRIADSDDHFPLVGGFATFLLDKDADPTFVD